MRKPDSRHTNPRHPTHTSPQQPRAFQTQRPHKASSSTRPRDRTKSVVATRRRQARSSNQRGARRKSAPAAHVAWKQSPRRMTGRGAAADLLATAWFCVRARPRAPTKTRPRGATGSERFGYVPPARSMRAPSPQHLLSLVDVGFIARFIARARRGADGDAGRAARAVDAGGSMCATWWQVRIWNGLWEMSGEQDRRDKNTAGLWP